MSPGLPASCFHLEHFLGVMIVEAPALIRLPSAKIGTRASCEETELSGKMKCPWWQEYQRACVWWGVCKLCGDEVQFTEGRK